MRIATEDRCCGRARGSARGRKIGPCGMTPAVSTASVNTREVPDGRDNNERKLANGTRLQSAHGIEGGILEDCDGLFDDAALSDDEAGLN